MREVLTKGAGGAMLRALLDAPDGLTSAQIAQRVRYAQNTIAQAANLAAYDGLIECAGIARGPGRPSIWRITPGAAPTIRSGLVPPVRDPAPPADPPPTTATLPPAPRDRMAEWFTGGPGRPS
jgi:hypothetical protein